MQFKSLVPSLDVTNVDESIKFYKDALGFSVQERMSWNGETGWALLKVGRVGLMLNARDYELNAPTAPQFGGVFFFYSNNLEKLHEELTDKGYPVSNMQSIQSGIKEFYLCDPDGYVFWFTLENLDSLY